MLELRKLSVGLVIALVSSLFTPQLASAYDPGPIIKTVKVLNSQGSPYGQGAEVALVYRDSLNDVSTSPVVLTNSNGEASFTVRATDEYMGIAVTPSLSDQVHALNFLDTGSGFLQESEDAFLAWNQTFTVRLELANAHIMPLEGRTGNSLAPAGTRVAISTQNGYVQEDLVLIRPGKVGVFVGEEDYANIGLRPAKKRGSQSFVPMTFTNGVLNPNPSHELIDGAVAIRLFPSNLFGQLRSATGAPIAIPSGVTANIRFVTADVNTGEVSVAISSTLRIGSELSSNGAFEAFVPRMVASLSAPIALVPQVFFTGSNEWPSFIGSPIWVGTDGRYSTTSNFVTSSATLEIRLPEIGSANVMFDAVRLGTEIAEPSIIEVRRSDGNYAWWGRLIALNGKFAYRLPQGNYDVTVIPLDTMRPSAYHELEVAVDSTALRRSSQFANGPVANLGTASAARFKVSGELNNEVQLVVVDPVSGRSISHELVEANIVFAPEVNSRDSRWFSRGAKGLVALDLPNPGEYVAAEPVDLQVKPKAWMRGLDPLWTSKDYRFDLSGPEPRLFIGNQEIPKLSASGVITFAVKLGYANVYGNLVDTQGVSISYESEQWISAQVQKYVADQNRWDWFRWIDVTSEGRFGTELPNGTYRISFEPNGFDHLAKTVTPQFTISDANRNMVLTDFQLAAPRVSIEIVAPGSSSPLPNTSLQLISRSANIYEWLWIGPNGKANLSPENGEYELQINPPQAVGVVASKRSYRLVVSNAGISIYDLDSLISPTSQNPPSYKLALAAPNLSGRVLTPNGASVRYVQVVPVDSVTKRELWELSVNTDINGDWHLNLPEGTYDVYARAPWGSQEYGNSAALTGVQINSSRQIVAGSLPATVSANAIELRLRYPLWSGVIVDPVNDTPLTNGEVCLFGPSSGACAAANDRGAWALSRPNGMTGFDGWTLLVRERGDAKYTEKRYEGSEINQVMSYSADVNAAFRDIRLTVQVPNLRIRVLAGGVPVANSWVSLDRPGFWLGGANTDADGYAKLNIANPETPFFAQANIGHISSLNGQFTSTRRELELTSANASNGVYTATLNLSAANFKATALEKLGNTPIAQGWASLIGPDGRWIANSDWNSSGNFSFAVPTESETVTYRVEINPRGSQGNTHVRTNFDLEITPQGAITVKFKGQAQGVVNDRFQLRLTTPNVTGKVVNTYSQGVRDSYVVPIDTATNWYLWQQGTNSQENGAFSMNLEDGVYKLEASVPWYLSGLAKSARCTVVVSGNVTAVADQHCLDGNNNLELRLREPNLKFRLVTPEGEAVPYANVGVGVANYHVNAQSDRQGYVSLFLDEEEMKAAADEYLGRGWMSDQSPSTPGVQINIRFWVDPPWGNSSIVRWDCGSGDSKPICNSVPMLSKVSGTWESWTAPGVLPDVAFPGPNTRVQVFLPGGTQSVGEGAWISVFKERTENWGTWREWVGGSNTDRQGRASFLIQDADLTSTFSVEVNAPWHLRSTYPTKIYSGLRLNQATSPYTFDTVLELPNKNLTLTVRQSVGDKAAKWSWISVEKYENNNYSWLNGSGTDELGRAAFYLEPAASVQYRLTFHPGPGSEGTMFSCFIATSNNQLINSSTAPSGYNGCGTILNGQLTVTLSTGNTRGTIVSSTSAAISGAIVLAQSGQEFKSAVTNARGEFFMQLDTTKTWQIKVLYANPLDANPFRQRIDSGGATVSTRDDTLTVTFDGANNAAVLRLGGTALVNNAVTLHRQSEN